jgi:hypothetical protein
LFNNKTKENAYCLQKESEKKKGGLHVQIRKQKLKQKDKSHKKTKHVQIKMKIT